MTHRPVGAGLSISTTNTATATTSFSIQSDTLRIVALGANAFVAIGTNPTATLSDYLIPAGTSATLAMTKASQRVVGITTGTTTVITCPEGTQMPFVVGDRVTLSGANFAHYNTLINNAEVISVNTSSDYTGNFQTSITVDANTAAITTSFSAPDASLRRSHRVSAITNGGAGSLFIQQIQITNQA
jgi:hypothetical protein